MEENSKSESRIPKQAPGGRPKCHPFPRVCYPGFVTVSTVERKPLAPGDHKTVFCSSVAAATGEEAMNSRLITSCRPWPSRAPRCGPRQGQELESGPAC